MKTQIWVNESASQFNSVDGKYTTGGSAVCLPNLGSSGMVMLFGGSVLGPDLYDTYQRGSLIPMDNITIYDHSSKRWYWQTTTGGPPPPRLDFCAVGIQGPNGTFDL